MYINSGGPAEADDWNGVYFFSTCFFHTQITFQDIICHNVDSLSDDYHETYEICILGRITHADTHVFEFAKIVNIRKAHEYKSCSLLFEGLESKSHIQSRSS